MSCVSALGEEAGVMRPQLFAARYPGTLTLTDAYSAGNKLPLGCLPRTVSLADLSHVAPRLRSRNNALALTVAQNLRAPLTQAIDRFGPTRIEVLVGTSTSGLSEGQLAASSLRRDGRFPDEFDYAIQEMGNVAEFLAQELRISGPAYVISTACSSSAKALASAARLISSGLVDAVVAGGVDALCSFTVAGFNALESIAATPCNPSSVNRCGINLGGGGAFFLLSREPGPIRLAGWGESQDAYHISGPHPDGTGAIAAMRQALNKAGVDAEAIDYVNMHGTATLQNDAMEHRAINAVLGGAVWASSTKPITGHTLAAAGAVEAAIA